MCIRDSLVERDGGIAVERQHCSAFVPAERGQMRARVARGQNRGDRAAGHLLPAAMPQAQGAALRQEHQVRTFGQRDQICCLQWRGFSAHAPESAPAGAIEDLAARVGVKRGNRCV